MKITIKTEKFEAMSSDGLSMTKMRRVLEVRALQRRELPLIYLESTPRCVFDSMFSSLICTDGQLRSFYLHPNDYLSEEYFQKILTIVKESAERLRQLNYQWKGPENFEI